MRIDLTDGRTVEVDPRSVVRLSRLQDPDATDPPTLVTLDDRSLLTHDSMRTIGARIGDDVPMRELAVVGEFWSTSLAIRKIVMLTKASEDGADRDPTCVHLSNGKTLTVTDSIRTLSAGLSLLAGMQTVDVDRPDSERPAAIVADHVRFVGTPEGEGAAASFVVLTGGWSLPLNDDPDRLGSLVDRARSVPEDAPASPVP